MRRAAAFLLASSACVAAALALPRTAAAQRPRLSAEYLFKPGNIALSLAAGGSAFTDFQQDPAEVTTTDGAAGSGVVSRSEISRRISAQTTATLGAGLALWLSSRFALQFEAGYTPTRFRVINETNGPDRDLIRAADSIRYARLDLWSVSGNVLLRPPVNFGRVSPYAILGAGAVRFQVQDDPSLIPPEARSRFASDSRTQFLAVLGAGAVIPLQRKRLLLSFDLTDHLTHTPLSDRTPSTAFQSGDGEVVVRPDGTADGSDGILMTSNVRLTVGLTIPLRIRQAQ